MPPRVQKELNLWSLGRKKIVSGMITHYIKCSFGNPTDNFSHKLRKKAEIMIVFQMKTFREFSSGHVECKLDKSTGNVSQHYKKSPLISKNNTTFYELLQQKFHRASPRHVVYSFNNPAGNIYETKNPENVRQNYEYLSFKVLRQNMLLGHVASKFDSSDEIVLSNSTKFCLNFKKTFILWFLQKYIFLKKFPGKRTMMQFWQIAWNYFAKK